MLVPNSLACLPHDVAPIKKYYCALYKYPSRLLHACAEIFGKEMPRLHPDISLEVRPYACNLFYLFFLPIKIFHRKYPALTHV